MSEYGKLEDAIEVIDVKARSLGLDFFDTEFEIVSEDLMAQIHAYILPVRFQHWTFGKRYHQVKTRAKYGVGGFAYETVINSNPAYSFLLENNTLTEMKTVVAHVLGHVDFDKNNSVFANTNRRQVTDCAVNAQKIADYAMRHGEDAVEQWIDACMALVPQIEFSSRVRRDRDAWWTRRPESDDEETVTDSGASIGDEFDFLFEDENLKRLAENEEMAKRPQPIMERDLLHFLMNSRFADLERWQRDVMSIVHEEWMYFQPNIRTKIMNEGWATYWHIRIMEDLAEECDFLKDDGEDEFLRYARMNAWVLARGHSGGINPYLLGYRIWKRIVERWDDPSDDDRRTLGLTGGQGVEKMFEVRRSMTDAEFVRNFLDRKVIEDLDLFSFQRTGMDWTIVETDWKKVRDDLTDSLMVGHTPIIYVVDDDYQDRREMMLFHEFSGRPLAEDDTKATLSHLARIWKRPVHLVTVTNTTYEVGMSKEYKGAKRVIHGEPLQVTYSSDGVNPQVAVYMGKPITSPSTFARDYFESKWHAKSVADRLLRGPVS